MLLTTQQFFLEEGCYTEFASSYAATDSSKGRDTTSAGRGPSVQTPSFQRACNAHSVRLQIVKGGLMYTEGIEWALTALLSEPIGL